MRKTPNRKATASNGESWLDKAFTGAHKTVQQAREDPAERQGAGDPGGNSGWGCEGPAGRHVGWNVMPARRADASQTWEQVVGR